MLTKEHTAAFNATKRGSFIASTSENGHSASFFTDKGISPTIAAKTINLLFDLYEATQTALGYTVPTQAQESEIYLSMMGSDTLAVADEVQPDFSYLRGQGGWYR